MNIYETDADLGCPIFEVVVIFGWSFSKRFMHVV